MPVALAHGRRVSFARRPWASATNFPMTEERLPKIISLAVITAANHVPKTYLVKVNGTLTSEQEESFRHGIPLEGRRTAPAGLKLLHRAENPWYEVRLIEGRKHQIRVMFKYFGRLVEKLK